MSVDARRSGAGPVLAMTQIDGGEYAARHHRGVCGWVNDLVPGGAEIVLTSASLVYNIPEDHRVMLTQYCYGVNTVSDSCRF